MSGYLNESVAPCDNFYQFACGKYPTVTKIPADYSKPNEWMPEGNRFLLLKRTLLKMLSGKDAIQEDTSELSALIQASIRQILRTNIQASGSFDFRVPKICTSLA